MPQPQIRIKRIDEGVPHVGQIDKFAWQRAKSRSGGVAAVNEKGRKVYGAQAIRVLAAASKKSAKPKADAAPAPAFQPSPADNAALQSSHAVISKIKSGKLTFPELVQHIQAISKLKTPALVHHAKALGSKEKIASRDTALKAIHDVIRSHRPANSPIRYAEENPVAAEKCDCTTLGEPKLIDIPGVEIFATGQYRDKPFTHADIDKIVANFDLLSKGDGASLKAPIVIGHSEEQAWTKDTGLPAVGRVSNVSASTRTCPTCGGKGSATVEGKPQGCVTCLGTGKQGVLWGDFSEVPSLVAKLIKQRAYRTVSSELYDDYEDQGKNYGVALRRVALLGGELPQVKSLADLPKLAEFSESKQGTCVVNSTVSKFCEGKCECGGKCGKEVEKFCQEGPNKGKPGPCPDAKKKKAKARVKKPVPSAAQTEKNIAEIKKRIQAVADKHGHTLTRLSESEAKLRIRKFCQEGPNAGKPGPCPDMFDKVIHTAPAQKKSPGTIYHKPYESYTPAKTPAIHHSPMDPNHFGREEIRHRATGGDMEKAIRAAGQAAGGIGKLGLGAGKLAAKGLWGLAKHVLWPVVKGGYRVAKAGLSPSEKKAMSEVIRMAEGELAKVDGREPRAFSDEQIHGVGTTFLRKFCNDAKIRKFCQTGTNKGKPGPCPEQSTPTPGRLRRAAGAVGRAAKTAGSKVASAAKTAGGAAVYGAKKIAKATLPQNSQDLKDLGVYYATAGWDPAFSRKLKQKHGSIPAAIGGTLYHALNLGSGALAGAMTAATLGTGAVPIMGAKAAIREAGKMAIDKVAGAVTKNVGKIRKITGKGVEGFAKIMNIPADRLAKRVRVGMKRLAKPMNAAIDKVGDAAYQAASNVANKVAAVGKGIGRGAKWVGDKLGIRNKIFSEADRRLLRKVHRVVNEIERRSAVREKRSVRQFSDDQIRHVCYLMTA